ncbi:GumC family protein [Methylobacterium sp. Leaf118]|uniref:GumC family protein n=1 Tax=Methylobacterium sp. Leaf118 TaxID=2876562 RepID=UPI001E29FEC3|nr:exopolysaccharide transport family protein [Methylobacterium sp. Leaf118]
MLQLESGTEATGRALALPAPRGPVGEIDRSAEIGDLWRILWRRRTTVLWTTLLLVAGTVAYCLLTPALYTATSQILIDPRDRQVLTNDINPAMVAPDGGVTQVESQARVLESAGVLMRAAAATGLTDDPEFIGRSEVGALVAEARALVGWPEPEASASDVEDRLLRNLRKRLAVKRADRVFVIDIVFTAKTPEKAARVANAIAAAYLVDQGEARAEASRRASTSLTDRLGEQRERVREAENRAEAYRAKNDLVRSNGRLVTEQQLGEINVSLSAAQAKTAELKARLDQIEATRRSGAPEAINEAIQSNTVGKLRAQYAELAERQADLRTQLGARHPSILAVTTQLQEVRGLITAELGRIAQAARADYERAAASERAMSAHLARLRGESAATNQAAVKLRELEREVESSRSVYTTFLTRAREIEERAGIDATNARVVTRAIPPQDKSWPLPALFILGAATAGLGLGTGLALVREYASPAVLSRGQFQGLTGAPVIGLVPDGARRRGGRARRAAQAAREAAGSLALTRLLGIRGGTLGSATSVFVTSAASDATERRRLSQLLAGLAEARGLQVLMIEADTLGPEATPGLLDVLRGDEPLGTVLRQGPSSGVRLLGVGRATRGAGERGREARDRFRAEIGRRFDLVVIDGGAITENPQAAALMPLADGVLLVARLGATAQRDVAEAVEAAGLAGHPVSAGVIVTRA